MSLGILGNKIGMTQIFDKKGNVIPVTVIKGGPCYVTQIKSIENYNLETDNDDISVYLITDDDYKYFQEYYKQKRHKLECNRMKYYKYDYDVVQEIKEYFWHLVIELDGKKDKLFNKEFINKYNSIIEQKSIL